MTHEFFHISASADFASDFMNTGARNIGRGQGGQSDGFYVWTNRTAAYKHIVFKNRITPLKKTSDFQNAAGLLVGITVPTESIKYPTWQLDLESATGLEELWFKHRDFLNKHAHDLHIPLNAAQSDDGKFTHLTGLSYEFCEGDDCCPVIWLERQHHTGGFGLKKMRLGYFETTIQNSGLCQLVTDYLCQNDPAFLRDYNALLQAKLKSPADTALKYTGTIALPVSSLERIQITGPTSFTSRPLPRRVLSSQKQARLPDNQNQHQ